MKSTHTILILLLCITTVCSCRKDDSKTSARPATNDSTYVENDSTRELKEIVQETYMWYQEHRLQEIYHLTTDDTTLNEVDTTSKIFALQMLSPSSIQLPSGRVVAYYRTVDSLFEYRYQSPDGNAWLRLAKMNKIYSSMDVLDSLVTKTTAKTTIEANHYWVGY